MTKKYSHIPIFCRVFNDRHSSNFETWNSNYQIQVVFEDVYEPCVVPWWVDVDDDLLVASFARGATPWRRVRLLLGACGAAVDATLHHHLDLVLGPGPELCLEVGGHVLGRQLTCGGGQDGLGVIQNCQNYQKSTFLWPHPSQKSPLKMLLLNNLIWKCNACIIKHF